MIVCYVHSSKKEKRNKEVLVSRRGRAWGGVAQHEGSVPGTVSKVEGRKVHTLIDLSA
jgi:hypothetical protein